MEGMEGYVGIFRCLLEKPIWLNSTPEQKVILITILLRANHKESEWEWQGQKFKVKPGQFITSLENLKNVAGRSISIKNVRTALERFEKFEFIKNESTKTGRVITVINWDLYQNKYRKLENNSALSTTSTNSTIFGNQTGKEAINLETSITNTHKEYENQKRQSYRQRGGKEVATNNNDNNNNNNNNYGDSFEKCWKLYPRKKGKNNVSDKQKKELANIPEDEMIRAIERYRLEIEKDGIQLQYVQYGSTFFNGGYIDYLDKNYQSESEVKKQEMYPIVDFKDGEIT